MKIALIYTGAIIVPDISKRFQQAFPDSEIMNILDDSLIADIMKAGGMTQAVSRRMYTLYQYAYDAGADLVVNTCSSVGATIELGTTLLPIPFYRIDGPMAEKAVASYSRIGVIATLATTLIPTLNLIEAESTRQKKAITVVKGLAEGAYEAAVAGDRALHDQKILETAKKIKGQCDVILFAQASMERMVGTLESKIDLPVLASPQIFIESLVKMYGGKE
jgi:hypothetical protein